MSLLKRIFKRPHKHGWIENAWNPWCIAVEERCRCGAKRHHFMSDNTGIGESQTINWRDGAHPIAEEMRRNGEASRWPKGKAGSA